MRRAVGLVFLLGTILFLPWQAQAASRVEVVTAETFAQSNLPPLVAERMNRSVATIASQLLEGKEIAAVQAERTIYEKLIHEVFNKVLVGYTVRQVTVEPAVKTKVKVDLIPWAETIRQVQVDTAVEGMPPRIEKLVRQDLAGVESVFQAALIGLPTAAADWTNGVLKQHLGDYLQEHLPEFRADFDLDPEPVARVKLTVFPRLPVVRTVDLSMRSDTLPNSALLSQRKNMQKQVDDIVGVPVAFVQRHRDDLERQFAQGLDSCRAFRVLHMQTKVKIEPAERVDVMSRTDSSQYHFRLSGWLDIGRNKDRGSRQNLLLRLHAGRMLGKYDEIFAVTELQPEEMSWGYQLGWGHLFRGGRYAALRYDLQHYGFIYEVRQKLSSRWLLRYEYRQADRLGEVGIRYRLHDFLGLEYIFDNEQNWLRLIGNF
ncbi:acylphosphatase [Selenomonas sp.]|uniref:acylphosphatase n=1 Tax=Selenomonas sp. TaxID=2053611 RepID=UPI0025CD5C8A|nr:acylphosphatase [Selenomonas sp.]